MPKDGSAGRGFHAIKTCALNRGNLIIQRKSIIDDYISEIRAAFVLFRNGDLPTANNLMVALQIKLSVIREKADASKPYSFVSLYISQHFSDFVVRNFQDLDSLESQLLIQSFNGLP